ncbi:MAG: alpha/beta hydrolase [Thaumarchaeota archaeon]|nr:alpha/beta hydrolase [Nitrososphaerota archaeon]
MTECPSYGYSLENQTRDLVELTDELKLKRPTIIVIAFGSTIAVNLGLEYPERVRAIVMVA